MCESLAKTAARHKDDDRPAGMTSARAAPRAERVHNGRDGRTCPTRQRLRRQEIAYTADGQRTLISGLLVACALEGLMTRNRATSRSAPAPVTEADPATLLRRSTADELAKLADLRDRGVLTDEEFARLKEGLIG